MPEGPELHLASLFVNRNCQGIVFTGPVEKSEVSKCPDVPFACDAYRVSAASRGKEVQLTLTPLKPEMSGQGQVGPVNVVFRFGMSGSFRFTTVEELPKHAHLRFYTNETPPRALSFVDPRRFGGWQPNGNWQADRGPCVMFEYQLFRENVLSHLSDRAFDRPICETLLNQKYFNGIGNYLRAEILFRSKIPPFIQARTVLEELRSKDLSEQDVKPTKEIPDMSPGKKGTAKTETSDILSLCHTVPLEVVKLGGKGYDPDKREYSVLEAWMQCYYVEGMKSLRDHNGRTIWFKGEPGPMAPKGSKSLKTNRRIKRERNDGTDDKKVANTQSEKVTNEQKVKVTVKKEAVQRPTRLKRRKTAECKQPVTPKTVNDGQRARKRSRAGETVVALRRSGRVTKGCA